jgi:hypothetical protein
MAIMDDIAHDAAARHMVVAFHGCTIPRGIQRTWPNVLTMEAVEGAERETPGQGAKAMDPGQDVDLAFTRNAIGSMDYTPVTFSAAGRRTSAGHELAEAVVYESGLQHLADSPESYAQWPAALSFLRAVPAAWDDTRLLAGAPDRGVTLARRSGTRWFVGALAAGPARTARVALRFLAPGRAYRARVIGDDGRGGLSVSERAVGSGDTLAIPLAADGGFAVELARG